jgi:iron complex transport system substrate-binding protein
MNMNKYLAGCCLVALLATSCVSKGNRQEKESVSAQQTASADREAHITPQYAKGFQLSYADGYILMDIQDPQNEESTRFQYALVERGTKPEGIPADYTVIEIPVRSAICMTSLQLSNFIKLGAEDKVVGITSTRHLFNQTVNKQLKEGKTAKIGIEGNFDNEVIMSINPDLILISPFKRGGYETMKDIGIPLIPHLGYKETTPLGQAEWIKFVGLLLGMEKEANDKFSAIEKRYNELKALTAEGQVKKRPIVFSGEIHGGNWYAVGGKSFLAQLFKDAGADYFLKDDDRSGGVTLDFETIYNQADDADYWRIVNSYPGTYSYEALKEQDPRYADFRAFREKGVIYCNMREKPFYESMPTEPEVLLADLLHIFHPDLLPDHTPVYYDLLK